MENKALKNKKFFDLCKYIFSYIMAASLPLVIVIVIFGTVFTQAYQREVEANQSSSLLSAQNSVELMLSQMENIVQMIQLEEDYSYDLDDQLPKAISLQKRLRRYQLSSGYLKDILFYTHGNTSICASSSTYSLDTYADSVNKMTAGKTHGGKPRFLQGVDEILTEAVFLCSRVLGIIHAAVDHGADRLQKGAIEPGGNFPDLERGMDQNFCLFFHVQLLHSE